MHVCWDTMYHAGNSSSVSLVLPFLMFMQCTCAVVGMDGPEKSVMTVFRDLGAVSIVAVSYTHLTLPTKA